jgi:hypothetical protein
MMCVFAMPSPLGTKEEWIKYLKFLGKVDTDDEFVVAERERAKQIIQFIQDDDLL